MPGPEGHVYKDCRGLPEDLGGLRPRTLDLFREYPPPNGAVARGARLRSSRDRGLIATLRPNLARVRADLVTRPLGGSRDRALMAFFARA